MAKRKIGSANVKDGIARGWFTIPERLGKGVYELLGEYLGNDVYRPSYDVKRLIIGWGSEFRNIQDVYVIPDGNRKLTITGKLVGFRNDHEVTPLAHEDVYIKIGDYEIGRAHV